MKTTTNRATLWLLLPASLLALFACPRGAAIQAAPAPPSESTLKIDLTKAGPKLSPRFYGLMTEEINHSYDGGLYAELIQNRTFQDDPATPVHWSLVREGGVAGSLSLDRGEPLSDALPVSLRIEVTKAGGAVGAANDGFWGVPIRPGVTYRASLYARAAPGFVGPLTLSLTSADGARVYARARVPRLTAAWKNYVVELRTAPDSPVAPLLGRFEVTASHPGTFWLNLVSLFPPTYENQPNGFRPDLMQKLAALKPGFLRLPGGNYLEGGTIATRFDWKKTIGPLIDRPGHPGPWGYRSSDGLGLLEYLEWCEDLKMEPVLAVYAGYSLDGEYVAPGAPLAPYVRDALDEIEYVTGDAHSAWGAVRARDGHPKPFPLRYVEIGNEDGFDRSGSYDGRFAQFYDAIKARYPSLKLIATDKTVSRAPDVIDEHYYRSAAQMEQDAHHFDSYDRKGPKVFVGEWASYDTVAPWERSASESPTPALRAALGDAAWMTGLERNADIVVMECYAPLLVNVNPGASQWRVNLIGFDALSSYGSPSYYVQTMFDRYHGDKVAAATLTGDGLFESVTRDNSSGTVYVHLVNIAGSAQPVRISIAGAQSVSSAGPALVLSGDNLADTNTIAEPARVVPVAVPLPAIGRDFVYTAAPYSVTVLRLRAR